MENRMRTHPLEKEKVDRLLDRGQVAALATVNADGTPYVTPVHFWYDGERLYVHGLPAGQKVENIKANPAVSMTVWEMAGLLLDEEGKPCDTNTEYESVILQGKARLVEEEGEKVRALAGIVEKYTPHLAGKELPPQMVKGTAVLEITVTECTGKYYR